MRSRFYCICNILIDQSDCSISGPKIYALSEGIVSMVIANTLPEIVALCFYSLQMSKFVITNYANLKC